MTIEEKISNYIALQEQLDVLKAKMDEEKVAIIEEMEGMGKMKLETPAGKASVIYKTNIKYSDETSIVNFCENNGFDSFVVKKVNTTALNKELKKGGVLTEGLKNYYNESETKVLKVERND